MEETPLPQSEPSEDRLLTSLGIGLPELETFLVVAAECSFSQAARRLNLSQPAVTTRVQKLEQILGTRLFRRTTRKVALTAAGEGLARDARDALQGLNRIVGRMLEESGKARRRLAVATTPMVAAHLLPAALQRWHAEHPGLPVVVRDLRHAEVLDSLDTGECDLAVIAIDEPIPRFSFRLLMDDEVVVIAPEGHDLGTRSAIPLVELAAHPVMMLEQYTGMQTEIERACRLAGLAFKPSLVAANLQTIIGMMDAGAGLAVLPRVMATLGQAQPRRCLSIEGVTLRRRYGILMRRDHAVSEASRIFCDYLDRHWLSAYRAG